MALNNFVENVRNLSSSGAFEELATELLDSTETLAKNWNRLDNVLGKLDVQQHSMGVLYVLIAKFQSLPNSNADINALLQSFQEFIQHCNAKQARFAAHAYYQLCHLYTNVMVNQPNCNLGLKPLAAAIDIICTSETQLTPIHADLCQLSLKSKCFRVALKYLDVDITIISTGSDTRAQNTPDSANTDAKYFLLYYYYGGMIYTAMKNYERALYFFQVCISTPAMAISCIMVEAYKKFILVSLILHGKIQPLPKCASQVVKLLMKSIALAYHKLDVAFATASSAEVKKLIIEYTETFQRDNNMGLVKRVSTSLYKKNIQRLTKAFLSISLADVASRAQLPSATIAEKYILNMIKAGEINATIIQKDKIVVFKDHSEKYNSNEMFLKMKNDVETVKMLVKQINIMEEEIMLNPIYVKKALRNTDEELPIKAFSFPSFSEDPIN